MAGLAVPRVSIGCVCCAVDPRGCGELVYRLAAESRSGLCRVVVVNEAHCLLPDEPLIVEERHKPVVCTLHEHRTADFCRAALTAFTLWGKGMGVGPRTPARAPNPHAWCSYHAMQVSKRWLDASIAPARTCVRPPVCWFSRQKFKGRLLCKVCHLLSMVY